MSRSVRHFANLFVLGTHLTFDSAALKAGRAHFGHPVATKQTLVQRGTLQ